MLQSYSETEDDLRTLEIALYMIYSSGGVIEGRTRFEKMAYLTQRDGVQMRIDFDKDFYGPSSDKFKDILTILKDSGTLEEKREIAHHSPAFWRHKYTLKKLGKFLVESDKELLDKDTKIKIDKVVKFWKNKSKQELVTYAAKLWDTERKD